MRPPTALVGALAGVSVMAAMPAASSGSVSAGYRTASACQEDAPCWTWSRMGNRQRGVVLRDGSRVVVGPCRYAWLVQGGRLDRTRTVLLRGDSWAIRHGCS